MPFILKNRELLGLPPLAPPVDDCISPSPSQEVILKAIHEWLLDPDAESYARLIGPAGSGKSAEAGFIVRDVIRKKIKGFELANLVLAAPTHKAAREAEGKLAMFGIRQKFQTTSRLLCLRESISPNGEQKFIQKNLPEFPETNSLFIIDEVSMVCEYQINCLAHAISDLNEKRDVMYGLPPAKVLFVGDDRQLTPVKQNLNSVFSEEIPEFRLTEIVRHTGPVLDQSIRTRALTSGRPVYSTVGNGSEVWVTSSVDRFELAFLKALKKAYLDQDWTRVVAVAGSRARVAELCDKGRIALYGHNPEPFLPGERLLSTDAVKRFGIPGEAAMLCHSTTEIIVENRSIELIDTTDLIREIPNVAGGGYSKPLKELRDRLVNPDDQEQVAPPVFSTYAVKGFLPDIPSPMGTPMPVNFNVVADKDKKRFKNFTDRLKALILKIDASDKVKRSLWRDIYYPLMALNAPVQSALALTVHRAQGSTIPEVFVDFENIDKCTRRNRKDHNRSAYTAVTRASRFLGILDPTNTEELS